MYTAAAAALMGVAHAAAAQVAVPPVTEPVERTLERRLPPLEERVDARVRERIDAEVAEAGETLDEVAGAAQPEEAAAQPGSVVDTAVGAASAVADEAGRAVSTAATAAGAVVDGALRPFAADIDPFGRPIEKNVLVVLVEDGDRDAVANFGLEVVAERRLTGLGLTLVTLRGANGHTLARTAVGLRQAVPGAAVDFNHLYREAAANGTPGAAAAADGQAAAPQPAAFTIGMIDSAVLPAHPALHGRRIEQRDFVTHEGTRPQGHGTAVASLLADAAGPEAGILAASVFFQVPDHAPGATTESLVAALDWLATADVEAINMSLAGPPNALLERALAGMAADGPPVVAAVGNNGPTGEPLYPAAYPQVIGVTAVDRERRIFRYANRGEHVAFAALGVNVKVANAAGGYRIESGTSMASPRVAAVIAGARQQGGTERAALLERLIAAAEDLGDRGYDPVYGHGLVARPLAVQNSAARLTE